MHRNAWLPAAELAAVPGSTCQRVSPCGGLDEKAERRLTTLLLWANVSLLRIGGTVCAGTAPRLAGCKRLYCELMPCDPLSVWRTGNCNSHEIHYVLPNAQFGDRSHLCRRVCEVRGVVADDYCVFALAWGCSVADEIEHSYGYRRLLPRDCSRHVM